MGALRAIDRAMDRVGQVLARFSRPVRDGLVVVGLGRAAYYFFVQGIQPWTFIGVDARAYWHMDLAHPYGGALGDLSAYLYSPTFAQVMTPFSLLPFPIFLVLWTTLLTLTCAWLIRPWPWAGLILFLPISYELLVGNVHFLLAAMAVLGLRSPATWAFGFLTKITPGVGALWYAVVRDWKALLQVVGVTAALVVLSLVIAPPAWADWLSLLLSSTGGSQFLALRVTVGAILVAIGAATGRRWLVPVAVWLALPIIYVNSWVILLATIRLRQRNVPDLPTPGSQA